MEEPNVVSNTSTSQASRLVIEISPVATFEKFRFPFQNTAQSAA